MPKEESERRVPKLRFKGFTDDWMQEPLEKIVTVNSGKDYKHLDEGKIPVYGTGGRMTSVNESLSNIDAIGLGRKGTINKPQLLTAPFWTVDTLFYIIPKDYLDLTFFYYLTQTINWLKYDESTGVPSLSKKTLKKIKVRIPTLKEQTYIGKTLKLIDHYITLEHLQYKNIENILFVLNRNMFVRSDEKIPNIRFNKYDSSWELISLGEVSNISTGNMNTQDAVKDGNYPFYTRSADILRSNNYSYEEEAILIPGEGRLGEIYHYVNNKYTLHQRVYRISSFDENIVGEFVYWNMKMFFKRHILRNTSTSTAPSIRKPALENYKLRVSSSKNEQKEIINLMKSIYGTYKKKKEVIENLKHLKQYLLNNLIV